MILIHRCRTCGHCDLEPRARPAGNGRTAAELSTVTCARTCSCRAHDYGPPEVAPSFTVTGRRIERLAPPGTQMHGTLSTCPCSDCTAEHERLTVS